MLALGEVDIWRMLAGAQTNGRNGLAMIKAHLAVLVGRSRVLRMIKRLL